MITRCKIDAPAGLILPGHLALNQGFLDSQRTYLDRSHKSRLILLTSDWQLGGLLDQSKNNDRVSAHIIGAAETYKEFTLKECLFLKDTPADLTEQANDMILSFNGEGPGAPTCVSISLHFPGCRRCKYWGLVTSPPLINPFPSRENGFYIEIVQKDGKFKRKPCYLDLVEYYDYRHHHISLTNRGVYKFNGTQFIVTHDLEVKNFAETHFRQLIEVKSAHEGHKNMIRVKEVTEAEAKEFLATFQRTNLVEMEWFNTSTYKKFNFQNGVLDLDTMDMLPHSHKYGFKYTLGFDYNEKAKCPVFDKFLKQVMKGRQDLMDVLCETSGYCLSGDDPWFHAAIFFEGDGANGKSTFVDILCELAGVGSVSNQEIHHMKNETDVSCLDGKLFNISREATPNALENSSYFKKITAGETIVGRVQYGRPYEFQCRAKQIIICNELPKSSDKTKGLNRRMLIIPWDVEFSEEIGNLDVDIKDKLRKELPGIFNKFMKHYFKAKKARRFTSAKASVEAKKSYIESNDNVIYWWRERCVDVSDTNYESVGGATWHDRASVFRNYKTFTEDECGSHGCSRKVFWERLRRYVEVKDKQQRINGKLRRLVGEFLMEGSWND